MKNKKIIIPLIIILLITISIFSVSKTKLITNLIHNQDYREELELDNWELSTVFYDSTVNNGNTPLTEINWDASNGSYLQGETRVITVQVNYKNTNSLKEYNPGDLMISIPYLSDEDSNLKIETIIGANDSNHTGYDWNVTKNTTNKVLIFSNVNEFIKNSSFEGSIRIVYEITPKEETAEIGEDECLHKLVKNLKALLLTKDPQYSEEFSFNTRYSDAFQFENSEYDYYSLNFYSISFVTDGLSLKVQSPGVDLTHTNSKRVFNTYNEYFFYESLKFYTEGNVTSTQQYLSGIVKGYKALATSNTINFNYQRTYRHEWQKHDFKLTKTAKKVAAFDGITNTDDYIWVEYTFSTQDYPYKEYYGLTLYSKDNTYIYYYDELPEGCVVYHNGSKVNPYSGNTYRFGVYVSRGNAIGNFIYTPRTYNAVVGYPKSIYNIENNNLNITNSADLYVNYLTEDHYTHTSSAEINVNLADYINNNFGNLYSLSKKTSTNTILSGSSICGNCYYTHYYQAIAENDQSMENANLFAYEIDVNAKYIGNKITIKNGDDYLTATDKNGNYRKLTDNEYYINTIKIRNITNTYGSSIYNRYNFKLYVRDANSNNYRLYAEEIEPGNYTFDESEKIVEYYIYAEDIPETINLSTAIYINLTTPNISEQGTVYNYSYLQTYYRGENNKLILQNPVSEESYNSFIDNDNIKEYDINKFESYVQRSGTKSTWQYYNVFQPKAELYTYKSYKNFIMSQDESENEFIDQYTLTGMIKANDNESNFYNEEHKNEYDNQYRISGFKLYDYLPEGMELASTKQDIIESLKCELDFSSVIVDQNNNIIENNSNDFCNAYVKPYLDENDISIQANWNGTNRTRIAINTSFGPNEFFIFRIRYNQSSIRVNFSIKVKVSYDNYGEYGDQYTNQLFLEGLEDEVYYFNTYTKDTVDINENGNDTENLAYGTSNVRIVSAISTNQDIQLSAQSETSNYSTKKITTNNDAQYVYKARVRTGTNDIKNLVIYDSIENYAKDSEQNFINANGIKGHWQGEFLGVDTSYAESKGYNVKVYYSESEQPGSLKDDNTWQVYNDSVDKTKVKSLAFEYLDENNQPAVLPANSLTYVLIKMKSPSEEFKTFAYNGCWTEWNAIDPITEQPVDFITGINSNIVKVALPSSVEMEDMELTLTKKWVDNSNALNKRPENVTYHIVANGDYQNAQDITFTGTGNTWTTTLEVPKYDNNGEEITYEILEDTINLEDNYKYVSSIDEYEVTNTLYKNIVITKNWLDNSNAYLTRPPNITVKVYQNGEYYKDLNITGTYNTNTWTGSLSVPVYDSSGNEYNYNVDEINIDNYSTSCENLVCTNTLTGNENIVIQKEWVDNNNSYNTRPDSVTIHLKQNGNDYRDITLNGNNSNTWNSETVVVPKYDNNGVKYSYTVSEDTVSKYGLVEYDQEHYKVINTLKETTLLTITKIWKDNSNAYNTRPENLKITVLQNGNNYQEVTLSGDTDTWTTTLEVPKYDDDQQENTYSIKEEENEEYSDITYSTDSLTVTNGLTKERDLTITKIWDDNNNEYLVRPSSIKVKILQNGEEYQEVTINGNSNKWTKTIKVPYYDDDYNRYEYTIVEDVEVPKYGSVTYDQTTHTITNKLTEIPTVTLYFTVKTAYVDPITGELKYDEDGFNKILEKYNVKPEDEYVFTFTLKNLDTNKTYDGKLTTKGILEFSDIPYGKYEAVQGKDELFEFVDMTSLGEVLGVSFDKVGNKGIITIKPTGQDIVFGAQLLNKIKAPMENPNTKSGIVKTLLLSITVLLAFIIITFIFRPKKKYVQ